MVQLLGGSLRHMCLYCRHLSTMSGDVGVCEQRLLTNERHECRHRRENINGKMCVGHGERERHLSNYVLMLLDKRHERWHEAAIFD